MAGLSRPSIFALPVKTGSRHKAGLTSEGCYSSRTPGRVARGAGARSEQQHGLEEHEIEVAGAGAVAAGGTSTTHGTKFMTKASA
jgi:hypothetical protein